MSTITDIINTALNRLDKTQISSLYGLVLAISQTKREPKSILSGIASSLNNAVQAEGFGLAVNEALRAMSPEQAEEVLGRIQDLSKSDSQEAAVAGILRELSGLIDETDWESGGQKEKVSQSEQEKQENPPQSEAALVPFRELPLEVQNNMGEESKQAHLAQEAEG